MTHAQAVEQNLAEKYLLSELAESEREQFELHYFSCADCAAALKDGALFIETARDMVPPLVLPQPQPSLWERWFPQSARPAFALMAAALVMVSAGSIYQVRQMRQQIAEFETPRQIPGFTLMASRRGPIQTFEIPKDAREVHFLLDVSSEETFPSYLVEIGSESVAVSAPAPGGLAQILMPVSRLPRGEATVRVQGVRQDGSQAEVTNYRIKIEESP